MRFAHAGIALLSIAVTALLGCSGPGLIRATRESSLNVPWQQYAKIVVHTENGHVEIMRGQQGTADITACLSVGGITLGEAENRLNEMEVVAAADARDPAVLLVQFKHPRDWGQWSPGADLNVRVPVECATEVLTDNGRICVYDVGPARLETNNGRIQAEHVAGGVDARTSNGRIVLRDINGPCRAETSNGSIEIRGAHGGTLEAQTSNGAIDVEAAPPPDANVTLSTSNGAIRAILPANMAADFDASTSVGHVDVEFGSASIQGFTDKRDDLHAKLNGGGGQISATTSVGSVTIRFIN